MIADLVGNTAERGEVDHSRVRGEAGQDEPRAMLERERADAVHVDALGVAVHLVPDEREPLARDVDRRPVCQVAAVRQREPEHPLGRVPRIQERGVDRIQLALDGGAIVAVERRQRIGQVRARPALQRARSDAG